MTFFHFGNCVALAYVPYIITYKFSGLSEYSTFYKCVYAGKKKTKTMTTTTTSWWLSRVFISLQSAMLLDNIPRSVSDSRLHLSLHATSQNDDPRHLFPNVRISRRQRRVFQGQAGGRRCAVTISIACLTCTGRFL